MNMFLSVVLIGFFLIHTGFAGDAVYDGEIAQIADYSYMSMLTIERFSFTQPKTRCVSVIVSPEYAVTSAACARELPVLRETSRELTYGCSNLKEAQCNNLALRGRPILHPDYNTRNGDYDIAVFRIEQPVRDNRIQAVTLPAFSVNKPEGDGTAVFWARSENNYLRNSLRQAPVSVMKCFQRLESPTSFCVGNFTSPCLLERGSAFVMGQTLQGVLTDCYENQASFTNVAFVVNFINRVADLN